MHDAGTIIAYGTGIIAIMFILVLAIVNRWS